MSEAYTFYAIKGTDGLFFNNTTYGGTWTTRPRLWGRKQDAEACLRIRRGYVARRYGLPHPIPERFSSAKIVSLEVREIE